MSVFNIILILIFVVPVGAYLREQTYRNTHGNATIRRDLRSLVRSVKEWGRRKKKE